MEQDNQDNLTSDEEDTVIKSCYIPSWLNSEAEKAGLNFSALLQSAIKAELNIN